MQRTWILPLGAICALLLSLQVVASSSQDVTLSEISANSQVVLLGEVVALHQTGKRSSLGTAMQLAEIAPQHVAKGVVVGSVFVIFAPRQSDEVDLVIGNRYVLFMTRSSRLAETEVSGEIVQVYEVEPPDRGALPVRHGQVFSGMLVGEPDRQQVCGLLKRVSSEPCPPMETR